MKRITHLTLLVCLLAGVCISGSSTTKPSVAGEEVQRMAALSGRSGGHLVIGQRAEPKTLNPVTATDAISREVSGRLMADLIEINRVTQQTEPTRQAEISYAVFCLEKK